MTEIERLQKAIKDLHGCDSRHLKSVEVREVFQSQTVWQGTVEVFSVDNHPLAKEAYAWSYKNDDGEKRYVAVLGIPPVQSPIDAVRAYVAAEIKKTLPS